MSQRPWRKRESTDSGFEKPEENKKSRKEETSQESNLLISQRDITPDGRDSPAVNFKKPKVIGQFSMNEKQQFLPDRSQMKTIKLPSKLDQLNLDLNNGFASLIEKPDTPEHLNKLLRWIQSESDSIVDNVDFICWRGLFTKLISTPFENRESWCIVAVKWKSTIYLCEYETEARKKEKRNQSEQQKRMTFWGHRFEHYLTEKPDSSSDNGDGDDGAGHSVVVNLNEEFVQVVGTQLDGHRLLFGGEVDGMLDGQLVELKTNRIIESDRQYTSFCRFKLLKWWAQSFLLGINRIVAGFRDDDGIVRNLRLYDVIKLPSEARKGCRNCWDGNHSLRFCSRFLTEVKRIVSMEKVPVVLQWSPGDGVRWEMSQEPSHQFLPEWYLSST